MATVSATFDNLGEAAELERGTWPEGQALGEHFSVRECLPELFGLLAAEDCARRASSRASTASSAPTQARREPERWSPFLRD